MNDESGERVSVDLYQKVHTIARLAAALRAQVLQAEEGRSGGGSVSAPSASTAAERPEVRAKVSSLGEFARTGFCVPPYIVGMLASRAFSVTVTSFLRSERHKRERRRTPAQRRNFQGSSQFVLGSRADGKHLFYVEGGEPEKQFSWRADAELDELGRASLALYRKMHISNFAFR